MARSSQVRIIGDVLCPLASPHREISFGSRLQAPGDPPEEMLPMARARLFPKHLAIPLPQSCYVRAAQSLQFQQHASMHSPAPLRGCSPHSHERSFCFDMQGAIRYSPKHSQDTTFQRHSCLPNGREFDSCLGSQIPISYSESRFSSRFLRLSWFE